MKLSTKLRFCLSFLLVLWAAPASAAILSNGVKDQSLPPSSVVHATLPFTSGEGGSGGLDSEHVSTAAGLFRPGGLGYIGYWLGSGTSKYSWKHETSFEDDSTKVIPDCVYDDSGAAELAGSLSLISISEASQNLLLLSAITCMACLLLTNRRRVLQLLPLLVAFSSTYALDVDQDGLSDVFQRRYSLPSGPSATTADADQDGVLDVQEFFFGTDPTSISSTPHTKPRYSTDGTYILKQTVPGARYILQRSTDLRNWFQALPPAVASGPLLLLQLPSSSTTLGKSFYRFAPDPQQPDADSDGLNVIEEALFGTSDNQADIDGDGYNDAEEFAQRLDPLVSNNSAPRVNFLTQAEGLTDAGSPLTLQVRVNDSDPGDTISVILYEGSNQRSPAQTGPNGSNFDFALQNLAAGPHVFLAKATDLRGKSSWAAIPVAVRPAYSDIHTYGPIEGGSQFAVPGTSSDLRSNPFLRQPVFAGAIGSVSADTLYFSEQPNWAHGVFSHSHYLYVRSGTRLGAILKVSNNDPNTLKLDSADHGLSVGDLISVIPQWTLDSMLPPDSVHTDTRVHLANSAYGLPEPFGYRRDNVGGWLSESGEVAGTASLPPWGTFRILHGVGSAATQLLLMGDIATGARRITQPATSTLTQLALAPIAFQPMSLNELGLKDSTFVGSASDFVDVVTPGGASTRWHLVDQNWTPSLGASDGNSPVVLPGGALLIERAAPFLIETTWLQPFGK